MESCFIPLSRTNIFQGLRPEEIYSMLSDKPYQVKKFKKNEYLASSGDECRSLMIVIRGSVRGEMTDFSGKTIKIEDIPAPRPIAAAFIFGTQNRFPVDIIANEPTTAVIIHREILVNLLQNSKLVLKNYLGAISSRTQFLSDRIRFLTFKTIKEKIAHYILTSGGREKNTVILNQSQTELADFFGVTRPSLARALAELKSDGILSVEKRTYSVLNREKLNKLLSG